MECITLHGGRIDHLHLFAVAVGVVYKIEQYYS